MAKFMSVKSKVARMNEILEENEKKSREELVEDIRRIADEIIEEL